MRLPVARLRRHAHPCTIYEDDAELKRQFVPYLQAGLVLGERCVFFTHDTSAGTIIDAMQRDGFDLESYVQKGAFEVINTRDAHLKDGRFAESKMMDYWTQQLDSTVRDGFTGLRASVEMTWALTENAGCDTLAPYEARLNEFTDSQPVTIMCQYDRRKFKPNKLTAIMHAHRQAVVCDNVLDNKHAIPAHLFREDNSALELQVMIDNLELIRSLSQTTQALERAYDDLQNLAYTVSHELQEPIATIRSYHNLLSVRYRDRLGDDADEFMRYCSRSANTIARMLDDLWMYARIERPASSFEQIDPNEIVTEVLRQLAGQIIERNANVVVEALPDVCGVFTLLTYVFRQLVDNALRYCSHEHPQIRISANARGSWVEFFVEDDGPGIDPIYFHDVFRLFNRLGKRPGEDGTGMGLPICRRIVEHHQGKMSIGPGSNGGLRVSFTIPHLCPV